MMLLDWRKENDWLSDINSYAGDIVGCDLLAEIRANDIEGCWSDDMSWLPDETIVEEVKNRFLNYYSHVKAFHGCRPLKVSSYYDNGILGQNREKIEKQFKCLFSDLDDEITDRVIQELSNRGSSEKGKIYFVCDDKELIEKCGHYLIQGSEYIMAMAATLCRLAGRQEDYRLRLREKGVPTIFEVDIPLTEIPCYQVDELVRTILATWGTLNLFPDDYYKYDMSFVMHKDLSSEHISGHSHPEKIIDPHFGNTWYRFGGSGCDVCR